MIAVALKLFRKSSRIILDIRDLWPESAIVLGEISSPLVLNIGRWMERIVYKSADAYFFAVPGFKEYFKREFPEHYVKPHFPLMNGISHQFIELMNSHQDAELSEKFTVLYSGNIGLAQDLEMVLNAAKQLENEAIHFQIIGDGASKTELVEYARKLEINNVEFIGSIPRIQLINYIQKAHICLVPLIKNDLFLNAIPSKMLEYMAGNKPVVVSIKGEAEVFMKDSSGGICVEPGDANALVEAILFYFENPQKVKLDGESGANYVKQNFIKETLMQNAFQYAIEENS